MGIYGTFATSVPFDFCVFERFGRYSRGGGALVAIINSDLLDREDADEVDALVRQLQSVQYENQLKANYYYGKQKIKDLGLSIPPHLTSLDICVGWPGTAVDVLDERVEFEGWTDHADLHGLDEVFTDNDLDIEGSLAHLDALVYGTSFVAVSSGYDNEPDPLVTIESPRTMTVRRDLRTNRVVRAVSVAFNDEGAIDSAVLYKPHENVTLARTARGWVVEDRDQHGLNRVTVAQLVNRPQAGRSMGRSEITNTVRAYTDMAVRTVLGAEVAREFYAVPQRWIMGAPEDFFFNPDGSERKAWDAMMGKVLGLPINEDAAPGEGRPTAGAFPANSMDPFFNQVRALAQLLAAESAIPPTYLGFATDQVASADAIRAMESRLVKRAERRQASFGRAWTEAARLSVMVRDGVSFEGLPPEVRRIRPIWRDAATPTKAATADEVVKLIQVGVLTADGDATYRRLGMTDQEIDLLKIDKSRDVSRALLRLNERMAPSEEAQEAGNLPGARAQLAIEATQGVTDG